MYIITEFMKRRRNIVVYLVYQVNKQTFTVTSLKSQRLYIMEILSTVLHGLYKLKLTMIGDVAHEHITVTYI